MTSALRFKGDVKRPKSKSAKKKKIIETPSDQAVEGWTSASHFKDLKGPIVLSAQTPKGIACIAADAEGKLYISLDVDILSDSESPINTVEPNNTQQVFVISLLAFNKGDQEQFSFKTSRNTYLSADKIGKVDAKASAIGSGEMFSAINNGNRWLLKGSNGQFLSVTSDDSTKSGLRVELTEEPETFFTLRIQSTSKYVEPLSTTLSTGKISTKELEAKMDRRLTDMEVRKLKRAYKDGKLNEALLDMRLKSKTDTMC